MLQKSFLKAEMFSLSAIYQYALLQMSMMSSYIEL